jgi:agmatinase
MSKVKTFGGIEEEYAGYQKASVLLQSIPYDGTSTWGKGADKGFPAFLDAAENMELYDIETDSEVYTRGIHILPEINIKTSPKAVFDKVYSNTIELIRTKKFLTFIGGEHSVSIGILKAFYESYPGITIVQLDAHADLRPSYLGSPYNHACALHDASRHANVIQIGIRSMDSSELPFLKKDKCFFTSDIMDSDEWMDEALALISEKVYITFDLDGLDPSIMPGTGTPEPGGLQWYQTLKFLKRIFAERNVLGFDLVELAPQEGDRRSEFLTAKLYYKMLSYKFMNHAR